jgi:hypothetical protein
LHGGEEQSDEDGDDRYHHQQLDQRERTPSGEGKAAWRGHRTVSGMKNSAWRCTVTAI